MASPRFFIDLHGCPKAMTDAEKLTASLLDKGWLFVSEEEEREYTFVVTCGFLESARKECDRSLEFYLSDPSLSGSVVAVGCYPELFAERIDRLHKGLHLQIGVNRLDELLDSLHVPGVPDGAKVLLGGSRWNYLKISEGCSHRCAYCLIPKIRGPFHSRPWDELAKELDVMAALDLQEVVLISQDTAAYGKDLCDGLSLSGLLRKIDENYSFPWIRVMYLNPQGLKDETWSALGEGRVLPYFDIPFQHASPKVLKGMNRGGDVEEHLRLLERIRKVKPDAVFRTTLITGFPGEEEEDFRILESFVREARFDHMGVFAYSDEELAASFSLPDKVDQAVAELRRDTLYEVQNGIFHEKLEPLKGSLQTLVLEEPLKRGLHRGRLWFQAPEGIDGWAFVKGAKEKSNAPLSVRIEGYDYDKGGYLTHYER